ncbi:MAG: hypothetical protein R3D02_15515 [Hyphomicrobiales bacterium]
MPGASPTRRRKSSAPARQPPAFAPSGEICRALWRRRRNHRFGLDDAVLIKDNHIAACGGVALPSSAPAPLLAISSRSRSRSIRSTSFARLATAAPDAVLLDNMAPATLRGGRGDRRWPRHHVRPPAAFLETVAAIAETGVERISVGAITHSAPVLDLGLDFLA